MISKIILTLFLTQEQIFFAPYIVALNFTSIIRYIVCDKINKDLDVISFYNLVRKL